jgi:hypothetical protein
MPTAQNNSALVEIWIPSLKTRLFSQATHFPIIPPVVSSPCFCAQNPSGDCKLRKRIANATVRLSDEKANEL